MKQSPRRRSRLASLSDDDLSFSRVVLFPLYLCFFLCKVAAFRPHLPFPSRSSLHIHHDAGSPSSLLSYDSSSSFAFQHFCMVHLNAQYKDAMTIKCPFFRRHVSDVLDSMDMMVRFTMARHKSLPALSIRYYTTTTESTTTTKTTGLSLPVLHEMIRHDWGVHNNKGYYVTGRMTTGIYHDECWFDGPDPDMPVRGLYKYQQAASQLFHVRHTTAQLLDSRILDNKIQVDWELQGVLRLPWKPCIPCLRGTTTYFVDETDHLIDRHEETWEQNVWHVFWETLFPRREHNRVSEES